MDFVVGYEVCSLVFLAVVAVHYFKKRRLPNSQNRFFSFFVVIGILDGLLDVSTAYTIELPDLIPVWLNMVLNSLLYICNIALPALMLLYIICLVGEFRRNRAFIIAAALLPCAFFELLIFVNPFNGIYFSFENGVYVRGPWFNILQAVSVGYMITSLVYVFVRRKRLTKAQYATLMISAAAVCVLVGIQFFNREFLLSGMGVALAIVMMYMTLQDPSSFLDADTGLFNRETLLSHLDDFARRNRPTRVVLVAVADMPRKNMTYGFETGTALLKEIAEYIKSVAGKKSICFRLKGDQFAVITRDDGSCREVASKIHDRFKDRWRIGDDLIAVDAFICFAPNDSLRHIKKYSIPVIIDSILQRAKGRGSSVLLEVDSEVVAAVDRAIAIEGAIHDGVERDLFEVYFQPIYSIKEGRFVAAEALLRFHYDTLGNVPPGEFIELAENTQLITKIGEQVMGKVCRFIQNTGGLRTIGLDHILINLSPIELLQDNLTRRTLNIAKQYGVEPDRLMFEITETAATATIDIAKIRMEEMKQHGVCFALDDFGTGYANIDTIVRLPFHIVKLDKSILADAITDSNVRIVFEDIVKMVKRLGLRTIIEGVESDEMMALAKELDVDLVQGFLFSYPLPATELMSFLANQAYAGPRPSIPRK